ncbi:MAG TPA: aminotransferase class III-fold pyridoxal phosphate-dependent enzyme [Steroidobacteraceae bacterium]|nr:aminotransferase class III-fold pyridoxal phosphate-dependent enzyme [Steroidobacteraceae bacterium]
MTRSRSGGFGVEELPRILRGSGSYLYDEAGRRYLDGSGGPAAFSIGHGNPEVNAAIAAQLDQVACGYRHLFTSAALEQLTARLLRASGGSFGHVLYTSSGSEAVESALKVALQYFDARGLATKGHFIARERSYHGNSLGALSVSGFAERRRPFEGSLLDVSFVSSANDYRPPDGVAASGLVAHLAEELQRRILSIGAERVAAFIMEPVVGAAGGVVPAPPGYAAAVAAVCRRHDVLLIADEVMCGAGRCGTWRALEHDEVCPDIMTVAKGLAGGYIPIGAAIVRREIGATILAAHGAFMTGHTYSGHTAACAAAVAVQTLIEREDLVSRVCRNGPLLQAALRERLARIDEVGDVRGRGYLIGVEFVRDRRSKEPFPPERAIGQQIGRRALQNGLIIYPCSGNAGGGRGDTLIVAPPYNASDAELEELVEKLGIAVADTFGHR